MQPELSKQSAQLIYGSFKAYWQEFERLTDSAKVRYERRDWHGMQDDSRERLLMYKQKVLETVGRLRELLGDKAGNKGMWKQAKVAYVDLVEGNPKYEIAETFYNSVVRKVVGKVGLETAFMFLFADYGQPETSDASNPIYRTYRYGGDKRELFRRILLNADLSVPFEDLERDLDFVIDRMEERLPHAFSGGNARAEVLKPLFFRNKGTYLVGRICGETGKPVPFALPLLHSEDGVFVDALIWDETNLSMIFSFTRNHFMVQVGSPSQMVDFLNSLMPYKTPSELYSAIGFSKHGKTVFYRDLLMHMTNSKEKFVIAPGIKGMVMCVFTLPDYNVVFKLIKDKFDPPKKMTREQVKEKYELVKLHDRVGRMADTQMFENLEFNKSRFSDELLHELQTVAPSLLEEKDGHLIIKHLYTERKMIPLNLYLNDHNGEDAEEVVGEYGNAIKQLAAANIFPGDMLLKNFGVTRHRRVVFYDYDEICLLTECNFRRIPEARNHDDEFASEAWYSVGANDVFPEEFRRFLIGRNDIRKMFFKQHGDIFGVKFWKDMQQKQRDGVIVDVFPYRRYMRFRDVKV